MELDGIDNPTKRYMIVFFNGFPHFSVLDGRLRTHHPRQELDPWLWHAGLAEVSSFTAGCGLQLPELCRWVAVNWVFDVFFGVWQGISDCFNALAGNIGSKKSRFDKMIPVSQFQFEQLLIDMEQWGRILTGKLMLMTLMVLFMVSA